MPISCKPILLNNTPCDCVTAVTSAGLYGVASPLYPTTASLNALHTVQYDDRVVMYKRTATGWTEVQNYPYSGGTTDTDTRIEFNQVLPSGEWEWEIRDVIANTVLSTFTTPAIVDETITTLTGVQAIGKTIGTYTNEVAAAVDIKESITSFASIANGYQFTSEDGTVYPFTFVFDNSTPSSPQLLINYGATTVSTIPLNSYDVNIATTGGFALNPLTDEITITETDGEKHTIDLSYLRSTITSTDGSVQLVTSVNPDGSTNYDLDVKAHSNETQVVPYTGVELPTTLGVNIGDTKTVQFSDGTVVDYTWDGAAWVKDIEDQWFEERICLNTALVPFTPVDLNNPLVSEVDAWATANLTIKQRQNGTKLVYFVAGDGGTCDVPDYEWTLNKGSQLVTLSNKRVFNTKTVYVDAGSGSDVTGRRGYREFPFKTLNAAILATQTGDLLKVFPGDYTQTVTIPRLINIDCDNGVNWLVNTATFIATADFAATLNIKWNFYKLYGAIARQIIFSNSLGEIEINAYEFNLIDFISNVKKDYSKITNLINSRYLPRTIIGSGTEVGWTTSIENLERTVSQNYSNFAVQGKGLSKGLVYIKNLKSINSLTGYGNNPTIGYFFGSDVGINKQYTTIIDNVTHDDPNIYVTPPGPLDRMLAWTGGTSGFQNGKLVGISLGGFRNGNVTTVDIRNIKSTGYGVALLTPNTDAISDATVIVKLKGTFEKGIPIMTGRFGNFTNCKIVFDLDLECYTSMGVFIGFYDDIGSNNIPASNQIIVTGRIKTRYAGMSCISIGTGTAASNNTNGTILLKDLTLINDGTVSPIMCGVPENVQIQNVVTNSLVVDPNITEVGQSIIRNANYK